MLKVTVSQLNRYLRAVLEEDPKLAGIFVKGEIRNFSRNHGSGHCYFTLGDEKSSIRAVMFRGYADDLRFRPEDGMAVLVQASVTVYERGGVYQLTVTDIQPEGIGALALAYEQTKARLAAEGLFDSALKKPLPAFPGRIGVVTSESGAALQDIVNVLTRRYPLAVLVLCPAAVQGRDAPRALTAALRTLDTRGGCDVIILGRGGGSAEDLSAFNDEGLARAVAAARTPIVSAVGHETDFSVCDLAADLRAPTPSAAAELCTPSAAALRARLADARAGLRQAARQLVESRRRRLDETASRRVLRSPRGYLMKSAERLDFLSGLLYNKKRIFIQEYQGRLARRAERLDGLSPLRVLERGYCAAFREGTPVVSAAGLRAGESLAIRFRDGTAAATVDSVALAANEEEGQPI